VVKRGLSKNAATWSGLDTTLLVAGDLIRLSAGSIIPADCRIRQGIVDTPSVFPEE
jgi:magnesium-transporting ATPase (P-type)